MPYSTPADIESEWMKVTEAAAVIGVDPRTVKAMIRDGRLKVRAMQFDLATRIHRGDWENELKRRVSAYATTS
jgi:predicted site-specific integrase-resolvase